MQVGVLSIQGLKLLYGGGEGCYNWGQGGIIGKGT